MFDKNKKSSQIRPADEAAKGKAATGANAAAKSRDSKDKQAKSAMRSEGGKN